MACLVDLVGGAMYCLVGSCGWSYVLSSRILWVELWIG